MALITTSLNSGSNGNCYYIGNRTESILVDAGISCRETEKRMKRVGLNPFSLKAIFISHEHSDHIKGVEVLSKKYKLPVYISKRTLYNSNLKLDPERILHFTHAEEITIGNLTVIPFGKSHDAADPYGFTIQGNEIKIAVITDIGYPCHNVVSHFKNAHAAYLETNYDDELLDNGHYPVYLKRRIKSDKGHLSNAQALQLFLEHKSEFMSHIFLSHLSQDNNSPQLVQKLFEQQAGNTRVVVASRHYETEVYSIGTDVSKTPVNSSAEQLSIF